MDKDIKEIGTIMLRAAIILWIISWLLKGG